MTRSALFYSFVAAALAGMFVLPAPALSADTSQAIQIDSTETADRILEQSSQARKRIEARFQDEKHACADRFFASMCEEEARDRRRTALSAVRQTEIEANAYKRQTRTAQREAALAERNAAADAESRQRRDQATTEEKRNKVDSSGGETPEASGSDAPASESAREKQHAEKLRRLQAEESADAARRAERELAYEKKRKASEDRQKEVALHKSEKARTPEKRTGEPVVR
jgi:colicin import membrane protein